MNDKVATERSEKRCLGENGNCSFALFIYSSRRERTDCIQCQRKDKVGKEVEEDRSEKEGAVLGRRGVRSTRALMERVSGSREKDILLLGQTEGRETRMEKQRTLDSGKLKEFHSHGFRVPWMEVNSEERGQKGFQGVGNS